MSGKRGMRGLLSGITRRKEAGIRATGRRSAHVLAVAAQKGGVGKTTTSVSLACALAEAGHKILLMDIDPQGHVGSSLRDAVRPARVSLSDVLLSTTPRDLMEAVVDSDIERLWMTPADKMLNETDALLASRVGREYILQASMANARSHFDLIVIDCPPNLGNLTLNALVAADSVLIPCDMSILAFEGVADLLSTAETVNARLRHPLEVLGIVRTRVDRRTRTMNDVIGQALETNYGELVLDTEIPINSALAKAQAAGLSVFQFQPRAKGAQAYRALADEVLIRLGLASAPLAANR